ncbi:hypothetical protein PENTCL1PPCAC_21029, partial [Pristionchus entomophagus]
AEVDVQQQQQAATAAAAAEAAVPEAVVTQRTVTDDTAARAEAGVELAAVTQYARTKLLQLRWEEQERDMLLQLRQELLQQAATAATEASDPEASMIEEEMSADAAAEVAAAANIVEHTLDPTPDSAEDTSSSQPKKVALKPMHTRIIDAIEREWATAVAASPLLEQNLQQYTGRFVGLSYRSSHRRGAQQQQPSAFPPALAAKLHRVVSNLTWKQQKALLAEKFMSEALVMLMSI